MSSFLTIENAIVTFSATDKPLASTDHPDKLQYQITTFVPPEQARLIDQYLGEVIAGSASNVQQSVKFNVQKSLRVDNGQAAKPIESIPADYRRVRIYSNYELSILDENKQPWPSGVRVPTGTVLKLALTTYAWFNAKTGNGVSWNLVGAIVLARGKGEFGGAGAGGPNPFADETTGQNANPFGKDGEAHAAANAGAAQSQAAGANTGFQW